MRAPRSASACQSPAGVGFQLCAACFECQSPRRVCDFQGPGGHAQVLLARDDASVDQSFPIEIEVIFVEGDPAACGDYTLLVTGNVATSDRTCN